VEWRQLDEIGKDLLARQMYPYDRKGAKSLPLAVDLKLLKSP
jgi:hypothetical protein